jgi:hypothetical protein
MCAASVTEACETEEKTGDWATITGNMVESSKFSRQKSQKTLDPAILDDPTLRNTSRFCRNVRPWRVLGVLAAPHSRIDHGPATGL